TVARADAHGPRTDIAGLRSADALTRDASLSDRADYAAAAAIAYACLDRGLAAGPAEPVAIGQSWEALPQRAHTACARRRSAADLTRDVAPGAVCDAVERLLASVRALAIAVAKARIAAFDHASVADAERRRVRQLAGITAPATRGRRTEHRFASVR